MRVSRVDGAPKMPAPVCGCVRPGCIPLLCCWLLLLLLEAAAAAPGGLSAVRTCCTACRSTA